ncbi:hypothetical protein D9M71_797940 [compost metagenome]
MVICCAHSSAGASGLASTRRVASSPFSFVSMRTTDEVGMKPIPWMATAVTSAMVVALMLFMVVFLNLWVRGSRNQPRALSLPRVFLVAGEMK